MAIEDVGEDEEVQTVRAKVLKSFPYGHEPWNQPRWLPVGEVLEVRTEIHEGLVKEGCIEVVKASTPLTSLSLVAEDTILAPVDGTDDPRDAVNIPEGWASLPYPDKRTLAAQVKPPEMKIIRKDDVDAAINAEIARRAARPAAGIPPMIKGT